MLEQKLLQAERLASIGELAGILGMIYKPPLRHSRSNLLLEEKTHRRLDAEDLSMFESIDKSINYSNKIINDLLDYSSEITLDLIPATPKSLIADSLAAAFPPQNIKVVDATQDSPQFQVDVDKICRGFINIIKNAVDSMPNGGELIIVMRGGG